MGLVLNDTDLGLRVTAMPPNGIAWPTGNAPESWTVTVIDGVPTHTTSLSLTIGSNPSGTVSYFHGPSVRVPNLAYAAPHFTTTPWALLTIAAAEGKLLVTRPNGDAPPVSGLLGWKFFTAGATIVASPGIGPVATLTLGPPATRPWLTVVTQVTDYIAAGVTLYFDDLWAVAAFAGVDIFTIIDWIATAPGVDWTQAS